MMRISLAAALGAALASGCFQPDLAGTILCGESGLCPPGLTCQSDGICRAGPKPGPDAPPGAAVLDSLQLSAPAELDPPFSPGVFEYRLEVSVLVQDLTVTAEPRGGASVTLDGVALDSNAASDPVALAMGLTTIELAVDGSGLDPSTYTIDVSRSAEPSQALYAKASNAEANDDFSWDVAVSGNLMAVSALLEDSATVGVGGEQQNEDASASGAVYVFSRSASAWKQDVYIKASNSEASDEFGYAVALDGDTLAVASPFEDSAATGIDGDQTDNSANSAGAVYVFRRDESGQWHQEAYIKASNAEANDDFGYSLALSGDTLVVGAPFEDSSATGVNGNQQMNDAATSGAVYVFQRDGTTWSQEAYLKASNSEASDEFGYAVSIDNDLIAVGAIGEASTATGINGAQSNNDANFSGAAYLFRRTATSWAQEAYVKSSTADADGSDLFGYGVAVDGNRLIVGAIGEDSSAVGIDGNQNLDDAGSAGAVYAFSFDAGQGTWKQDAYIKASNTGGGDDFGNRVVLKGELLAVSAYAEDSSSPGVNGNENDNGASAAGAVYLFRAEGGSWRQIAYVKSSNPGSFDELSYGLALSRDTLVCGAPFEDGAGSGLQGDPQSNDANSSGAAYVFH